MPYQNEFAHYQPLRRIAESERVKQLLKRSRVLYSGIVTKELIPSPAPIAEGTLPSIVLAVDGSYAEVDVKNGYPGAKVGYVSVASVMVNLAELDRLDEHRPVNPVLYRTTEEPSSEACALPGCNVITRTNNSASDSFREAVFDLFHDAIIDEEDNTTLLDTYNSLLAYKPSVEIRCPNIDCDNNVRIGMSVDTCPCSLKRPLYPTDALRIQERFVNESGSNGEALGLIMQIWERLLLVHLLRCFESRGWLGKLNDVAFFLDGPLAVFGPPAWLSAAIQAELMRLNQKAHDEGGSDLIVIGIEKSGTFVSHFEEMDRLEDGSDRFQSRSYFLLPDSYIKQRIINSDSSKRYGSQTYFGRKFFYKAASGARIVATLPFLTPEQDTLDSSDISLYPKFPIICELLDKLVTSRYPNALSPIVAAHAQAAIPLHLGQKVLKQLATALMLPQKT
ncbi:MAG TPA: DNA double-strand break repair nuclease NurA [Candidatus Kapabacteria bacterium]|jgi:hypothetical protein|nr:DNA double-strand break repair nuclease NurA [Candidatus Kapabacteria bacterium]